jgi:hypothetical protein
MQESQEGKEKTVRRLMLAMVVVGLMCAAPQTAEASGAATYIAKMGQKVAFGLFDIIYSPVELLITPVTHGIDFDRHNRPTLAGVVLGVPIGFGMAEARFSRGVGDLVTFWAASERQRRWEWVMGGLQLPLSRRAFEDFDDAR